MLLPAVMLYIRCTTYVILSLACDRKFSHLLLMLLYVHMCADGEKKFKIYELFQLLDLVCAKATCIGALNAVKFVLGKQKPTAYNIK